VYLILGYNYFDKMKKIVVVNMVFMSICSIIILFAPVQTKKFGDDTFHLEAKSLVKFLKGENRINQVYITKAPAPTIWYTIPYVFVPEKSEDIIYWKIGVLWNLIMISVFTSLLIYSIYKYLNPTVGWLFLFVLYLIPVHIYYSMGILAEPVAFCGVCLFLAGTIGLINSRNIYLFTSFLCFGIFMLVTSRPNSILVFLFFPFFTAYLFLFKKYHLSKLKEQIFGYVIAFGVFICTLICIKQLPTHNIDNSQESYFIYVMHHGRFQFRTEKFDWRFWDPLTRSDSKDFQLWKNSIKELDSKVVNEKKTFNDVYIQWLIHDAIENPINIILQSLVRVVFGNYLQISSVNLDSMPLIKIALYAINTMNILILIGALFGIAKLYRNKKIWILILVPVVSLLVFHMFVYMEQRYLFVYRPILLFAFSYYIFTFKRKYESSTYL
jgi:hypothetical protein